MRSVLLGAVESSRVALETLGGLGAAPVAVITLPVERRSRHSDWVDLVPTARAVGAHVICAADVNAPDVQEQLKELQPDLLWVIGWSQILGPALLESARHGCVGYHPAPLPENRGRGVIPWTILQGVQTTGGTLFWLDAGVDSGDVLVQERFPVAADETARTLYDKHLDALRAMLAQAVEQISSGHPPHQAQDHSRATYCARRVPDDGLIDWQARARSVWALVRASGEPYPGAFTFLGREELRVWEADLLGPGPYWGVPGQVQTVTAEGALVQCGDREHVLLRTVEVSGGGHRAAGEVVRVHQRLGVDWLAQARRDRSGA